MKAKINFRNKNLEKESLNKNHTYEDIISSRYVPQDIQPKFGYFDDNHCCILRWTNQGKKCFYSIKDLNEWIKTNPDKYASCTYIYLYERSYDFPLYLPSGLQLLDVRFSKISYTNLPNFPQTLRSIFFIKCSQLQSFDILDCAYKCPELEELILYACCITQIYFPLEENINQEQDIKLQHENLRLIDLSFNHLVHIDIPKYIPTNVSILHLDYNMLTSIVMPTNVNRMKISLFGNEIFIENERNFMYNYDKLNQNVIYKEKQNVHSRSIQESSNNSIQIIEKLYQEKLHNLDNSLEWMNNEWKNTSILYFNDKTITFIIDDADDTIVHSVHSLTMKEIIKRIWTIIWFESDQEKKKHMAEVFKDELYHGMGLCFTGRFTRIVNCLSGFIENITIKISPMERLQGQVSALYKSLCQNHKNDDEKWLDDLFGILYDAELLDMTNFKNDAWPWIETFCDMFISDKSHKTIEYIIEYAKQYLVEQEVKQKNENDIFEKKFNNIDIKFNYCKEYKHL